MPHTDTKLESNEIFDGRRSFGRNIFHLFSKLV